MGVPKNLIKVKTASKGELVYKATSAPFSGSYYELNNKVYEGDSFRYGAFELVTPDKANKLYNSNATFTYSLLSGVSSQTLEEPEINQVTQQFSTNFFYSQVNIQPSFVREIDEESYNNLQNNDLYKTTFIGTYKGITLTEDQAEQQIPGVSRVRVFPAGDAPQTT
jgi:hypothetical protein